MFILFVIGAFILWVIYEKIFDSLHWHRWHQIGEANGYTVEYQCRCGARKTYETYY